MTHNTNQILSKKRKVKVFITSAYNDPEPITSFLKYAELDCVKSHDLVSEPAEADIILFIENSHYLADPFFSDLLNHKLVKKYPDKVYMYNPHDEPWYIIPGLYMCMPKKRFDNRHMVAGAYLETINPYIKCDFSCEPEFLFSFYGATSSPPRHKIGLLTHARGNIIISNLPMYTENKPKNIQLHYADLLSNSKYILCPRGFGPSSIRLFETLQAGRVPVIISDDLVHPAGPDWNNFAIFVPENCINDIPSILEKEEKYWPEKSRLARQAWEQFYAPNTIFNYFIDSLLSIDKHSKLTFSLQIRHRLIFYYYVFRKTIVRRVKETFAKAGKSH